MVEIPVYVPFVPTGVKPKNSERLGLGKVTSSPEIDRPINDPEETPATALVHEKLQPSDQQGAPARDREQSRDEQELAELAVRARLSGQSEDGTADDTDDNPPPISLQKRQRQAEELLEAVNPEHEPPHRIDTLV